MDTEIPLPVLINEEDSSEFGPLGFSPDGSMLIVRTQCKYSIYNIASRSMTLLEKPSNGPSFIPYSCGSVTWSPDSKRIYIADSTWGGSGEGSRTPGLWRYTTNGQGINLLPPVIDEDGFVSYNSDNGLIPFNKALAPWEDIANSNLYFLFVPSETHYSEPFSLVRSQMDGKTDRTVMRPDTLYPGESLWAPDGSFIIIVQNGAIESTVKMILVPIHPSLSITTLIPCARRNILDLHWGP